MVSWTNLFPNDPQGGVLTSFGRIAPNNWIDQGIASNSAGTWFRSPGTVDSNSIWRYQYSGAPEYPGLPAIQCFLALNFTSADFSVHPGRIMVGSMFVAPSSAFAEGVVPTPDQIRLAATWVARTSESLTAPGDLKSLAFVETGPMPAATKFWVAAFPTHVASTASTPSIANDLPVGDIGRGLSAWTNRSPEAPEIISPAGQTTTFAGSSFDLVFSPRDPDRIASFAGDKNIPDFDDVAGVQVQYAPRPTLAEPDPEWIDLPIANGDGTIGRGWFISQSETAPPLDGAKQFWLTYRLKIKSGERAVADPYGAVLPSGDWQIRVRTFDYGHAFPHAGRPDHNPPAVNTVPPVMDWTYQYTPDTYPALNTSPWSEPVRIFITPQVPAPVPVSPVNNIAVLDGTPLSLTWRYRNTFAPPYPQARRTVQIRRVGDNLWTTLADDLSSSASVAVMGFDLVSGNQYEWRVKVEDSDGVESVYSDSAYFWIVAAPSSGEVIPAPSETTDGGTLGCGVHSVQVYRRGGRVRVGEIRGIERVEWNRLRDDISDASITVKGWDIDCGNLLGLLHPWAYEIVIFRNNGESSDRVWEGPITLLTYEKDRVVIQAKDVMAYAYRRIIKQAMSDSGNSPTAGRSVVLRAAEVLQNTFAPDDPNVLAYLNVISSDTDAKQYRSLPAYSRTAYEEIDDMAANAGLDYTAVGRAIVLWGTKNRIGTLPEFRDKDLGNSPIVSEYGMSMANRYVVSDGNGVWGEATRLDEEGKDEDFGLVEMLSSTWASDSSVDTGTFTQEGVTEVRESFAESAERSIASRYPVPVVVRIPDNTKINPDAVISIQHLVPGVVVPLHSTSTLREVRANQKLDSVKVIEIKGEETITITLSPFSRQDNEVGETE